MSSDAMSDSDLHWWQTRVQATRAQSSHQLTNVRPAPVGPQGVQPDPDYIALANGAPRVPGSEVSPLAGSGIGVRSRNFLRPDQRRSFTTPAGQSLYQVSDPLPGRPTGESQRQQYRADQRAAEQASRLSGREVVTHAIPAEVKLSGSWKRKNPTRDAAGRLVFGYYRDPESDDGVW